DPMRQFAELAGDVRDPYPMFAGIRAETPVLHVEVGGGSGRYRHDEKAPRITSLFTVTSYELAQQVQIGCPRGPGQSPGGCAWGWGGGRGGTGTTRRRRGSPRCSP